MTEPKASIVEYATMRCRLTGAQYAAVRLLAKERLVPGRRPSPAGTLLPARKVALVIDRCDRTAQRVLDRLEDMKIFECTMRGAGRRANAYRFAPLELWPLSLSQRDAVEQRVQRLEDSRETAANGSVVTTPDAAQAFVATTHSHVINGRCDAPHVVPTDDVVAHQVSQQAASSGARTHLFSRESSRSLTQEGASEHAQPVIDAALELTDLFGSPLNRIAVACELVDEAGIRELVERVSTSQCRNGVALAELVELHARRIATRKAQPAPPARPDAKPVEPLAPLSDEERELGRRMVNQFRKPVPVAD